MDGDFRKKIRCSDSLPCRLTTLIISLLVLPDYFGILRLHLMHLEIQSHIFDNVDRPNLVDVAFSEFGPSVSPESRSKPCIILDLSIEVLRKY